MIRRRFLTVSLVVLLSSCAGKAPVGLDPAAIKIWEANEAAVGLGTLQHAAIELNKVQQCDPAPCHPLLSDANTRIVVEAVTDGLTTIRAVPSGWKATAGAALDRVEQRLDAAGKTKLAAYVAAARSILTTL